MDRRNGDLLSKPGMSGDRNVRDWAWGRMVEGKGNEKLSSCRGG